MSHYFTLTLVYVTFLFRSFLKLVGTQAVSQKAPRETWPSIGTGSMLAETRQQ